MDEIINETLDEEVVEDTEELDDVEIEETPDVNLEMILSEFSRLNARLEELAAKIEEMLAPIRTFAQKDLPGANTSEESAPALYYL